VTAEVDALRTVLDTLEHVRIFPLPSSVLIPGGHLPLHVFEPRYRSLVADALASDQVLGIPLLEAGWEADYEKNPPVRPIMGVGVIRAADRMADGRFNIVVEGVVRARILEELPTDTPYRVVRTELVSDHIPAEKESEIQVQAQMLRQLAVDLAAALPDPSGPSFAQACIREKHPGRLADLAAAAVLIDTRERQEFLEETDVSQRLRLASDALAQTLLHVMGGGVPS
jgi:Lon protease-like protein